MLCYPPLASTLVLTCHYLFPHIHILCIYVLCIYVTVYRVSLTGLADELEASWLRGTDGLLISQYGDGEVSVGISDSAVINSTSASSSSSSGSNQQQQQHQQQFRDDDVNWSEAISATAGQHGVFTVRGARRQWELALQADKLPGKFRHSTKASHSLPLFTVIYNCDIGSYLV
jgi:hypothetical protein